LGLYAVPAEALTLRSTLVLDFARNRANFEVGQFPVPDQSLPYAAVRGKQPSADALARLAVREFPFSLDFLPASYRRFAAAPPLEPTPQAISQSPPDTADGNGDANGYTSGFDHEYKLLYVISALALTDALKQEPPSGNDDKPQWAVCRVLSVVEKAQKAFNDAVDGIPQRCTAVDSSSCIAALHEIITALERYAYVLQVDSHNGHAQPWHFSSPLNEAVGDLHNCVTTNILAIGSVLAANTNHGLAFSARSRGSFEAASRILKTGIAGFLDAVVHDPSYGSR